MGLSKCGERNRQCGIGGQCVLKQSEQEGLPILVLKERERWGSRRGSVCGLDSAEVVKLVCAVEREEGVYRIGEAWEVGGYGLGSGGVEGSGEEGEWRRGGYRRWSWTILFCGRVWR